MVRKSFREHKLLSFPDSTRTLLFVLRIHSFDCSKVTYNYRYRYLQGKDKDFLLKQASIQVNLRPYK